MLIAYIAFAILGFIAGIISTLLSLETYHDDTTFSKKKSNNSKAVKNLTIGQTAYGLTNHGVYKGKITKLVCTEKYFEVEFDHSTIFDYEKVLLDREEVLKHIK